ncbi:glutathione S-transferase omega-2 isoform X2 [Symphalangus syndactylus]|uniref:glutathione S-transferase omega-2 isoform X2 n=1 Tax=Symphalangus syndactylus TaxID=9590 RepID=UPI0030051F72
MSEDATRTLGKGSQPPGPVPEGLIRIYSMRFCPYSHRTRLVLKAKDIRHEVVNINLRNKPEWYYTKHPFGHIPVLETSQCQLIYESVIACEYLDDAYPGRKLFPYDPYERARQKMLLELFCKVPHLTKECLVALRCGRKCTDLKAALRQEFSNLEEGFALYFRVDELGVSLYCPGWSAVAQSWLTVVLSSCAQAVLPPQPPE